MISSRFVPAQDEFGRWAVQDTAQTFRYLFIQRYADEDSAQSFCDIQNATEAGLGMREKDRLWAVHERVCRYAALLPRSAGT